MPDLNFTTYNPSPTRKDRNLTGRRFNQLAVIAIWGRQHSSVQWLCRCDCGSWAVVTAVHLRSSHTRSCGCWQKQRIQETRRKVPKALEAAYGHFLQVKNRCNNPNNKRFTDYGGRGIKFCFTSFEQWYAEVGAKPSPLHSIDRIDNSGHYEPGNVQWTTMVVQNRNKRSNKPITFNGRTQLLCDWAIELGINEMTLYHRLNTYNWGLNRSFTTPVPK